MEIKHPRRILVLGAPDCDVSRVLKGLTGTTPQPDTTGSLAGVSHEWTIKNDYYSASVPIWIDEVTDLEQWRTEFMKPEAKEVIEAVGAWIYCFSRPATNDATTEIVGDTASIAMNTIEEIVEQACGYSFEGTRLALDMSLSAPSDPEALEEQCMEHSFEYVHLESKGKNEFGEPQGLERVKEALETNDWNAQSGHDDEEEDTVDDFAAEKAQMNTELWGLKASLLDPNIDHEDDRGDEDFQVENLEQMMSQILAIRETSAGMPEAQRKAFASRAVNDLMKDL
ncbi:hypothetical protein BDV97DRAFT_379061 [Delphinella strobiligena]|nr:hypothetical protein BDV97DRAFT_379061 [Delphinella strobiligena]